MPKRRRGNKASADRTATAKPSQSKQAACIALLERAEGATLAELQKATGWQPHSVRGFLAGTLKKKLRLAVTSAQEERGRVYRLEARTQSRKDG